MPRRVARLTFARGGFRAKKNTTLTPRCGKDNYT